MSTKQVLFFDYSSVTHQWYSVFFPTIQIPTIDPPIFDFSPYDLNTLNISRYTQYIFIYIYIYIYIYGSNKLAVSASS